ncbi:MAG: fibronectin type III domain-containing protein, partial [Bacteroidales bacterium]|nr:fibronectin type III domain-containing protein [Candidatus Colimorpha merdihippi]
MFKQLQKLVILLAMAMPWMANAQSLSDYSLTTDTTTFTSIVSTGTAVSFSSTDDGYGTCTLPFAFGFGESSLPSGSSIALSANGFIYLGASSASGTSASYTSTYRTINPIVNQDAHIGRYSGSGAYYEYDAANGVFTIEYHLLGLYSSPYGEYSFQVKLHSNGDMELVYDTVNISSASPTLRTFFWDAPNNDLVMLSGPWASPTMVTSAVSRPTSNLPVHGLRYYFHRPVVTCPKPVQVSVTDLNATQATISWVDTNASVSSWMFYWYPSDTIANIDSMLLNDTSYTLTSLYPNTAYTVLVASMCSANEMSIPRAKIFVTPCLPIEHDSLPYSYGFEGTGTGTDAPIDNCWTKGVEGSTTPYPYPSTSYAHSGSASLYMYSYSTVRDWASLPQFEDSVNTLQISFWAKRSGTSYDGWISVGVMSDPNDPATFERIALVQPTPGTTDWCYFEIPLAGYHGTGSFITIMNDVPPAGAYSYNYVYVDDVTVDELPTCIAVDNLRTEYAGTDTLVIAWTPLGDESQWLVNVGSTEYTVFDSTITLTDLNPATGYQITVYALCDGDDTSSARTINARTSCPEYINIPYFEDFETMPMVGNYPKPLCWGTACYSGTTYPYLTTSYNSTVSLYMYNYYESSYANYRTMASLPAVDTNVNPIRNLELTFNGFATSSSTGTSYPRTVIVGVCSVAGDYSTFVGVDTITNLPYGHKEEYTVSFSNYTDTGMYITFVAGPENTSAASYQYSYVGIDDIYLGVAPTCPKVLDLHATAITSDSVYLAWSDTSANGGTYHIIYGPEGFNMDDEDVASETVYDTLVEIGELNPDTRYEFYVYNDCSGDSSRFVKLIVRTACTPFDSLPYFYGFEDASGTGTTASINSCFTKYCSYSPEYPYPDLTAASGRYGLYFYNYNYSGTDYSYLAMPLFNHQLDSLQLKFKMRRYYDYSYNYYNYSMKVGVMTDPTDITTFEEIGTYTATNAITWDSFTVYLASYTGNGRYIAFKDASNTTAYITHLLLDDIEVDFAPECGPVSDLAIEAGTYSAIVSWNPSSVGEYNGATVEYQDTATGNWTTINTTDSIAVITGLNPEQYYPIRVTNICSDGTGLPVSGSFETKAIPCGVMDSSNLIDATIGTGTGTSTYIPSYSFYNYGYSQQIFTPSEINAPDSGALITKIYLQVGSVAQSRNWSIYLTQVTDSVINNWLSIGSASPVWTGMTNFTPNSWNEIELTTPFFYDGTSPLMLTVDDNTGSYVSGNSFLTSPAWSNSARYAYGDGTNYNPATMPSSTDTYYSLNVRNNVRFFGGSCTALATCLAPVAMVTDVTPFTTTVSWAPGNDETSWSCAYKRNGDADFTYAGQSASTSFTFTGLQAGSQYKFRIYTHCATDSLYTEVEATTECAMITVFPFFENFNNWGNSSIPTCWSNEGGYSGYPYTQSSYNYGPGSGYSMYFYCWRGGGYISRLTLPEIDTTVQPIRNLQLYFQALQSYTGYVNNIEVGVQTDINDNNTYTPVDTVYFPAGALTGVWYDFEVPLNNYSDTGTFITIRTNTTSDYTYFYLDDLIIETIPDCQRPADLVLDTATTTTFTCHWNERGSANEWVVEYGRHGFTPGTGTRVIATSNPFTVTGVPSSYSGEFYVYSICGPGDTSMASRHACDFYTTQIPATIPYAYNFEDDAEFNNWQTSTNDPTVAWYRGNATAAEGNYSMYVSTDQGATVGNYGFSSVINTTIYRDFDFGTVDTSFEISFKAKCGGTITAQYDAIMVFLVDAVDPVISSNSNITAPWGNVNDLYQIATLHLDTTWRVYRGSLDTISGVHRIAFFWFNQNTASYGYLGGPGAIDDIHIDYASCVRPYNLDTMAVGSTTAQLHWDGPASETYRVAYRTVGAPASTNQY